MKNILKKAENAEKLLNLTSDTMILLDRDGVCVDIAVHNVNLWFLTYRKKQRHSIPVSICKLLLINAIIAMGKLLVSK